MNFMLFKMFSNYMRFYLSIIIYVIILQQSCTSEPVRSPTLVLSSLGDLEDADVVMKREHDNLTLTCELRGDHSPREYVWTYVADNGAPDGERIEPAVGTGGSKLLKTDLQVSDSGQYTCSAPPFSVTKYILVTAGRLQPSSSPSVHSEPRPDTPNEPETKIKDLDFARLHSIYKPLNSIDQHTSNKHRTLRSIDGNSNVDNGNGNTVISGKSNVFNGNSNAITGTSNVITGNGCQVFGSNNVVNGDNNVLHGDHVVINGHNNDINASNAVFNGDNIHK